ncbi:DUF2511 domain-containing protein [Thorsellia kenyensis]|uniref:DUF2511 domain-containing protein n=1 Tax=Thorsellia kenyensis TaxID=1549888 RepID=A0ABV6CBD8_9GAMM
MSVKKTLSMSGTAVFILCILSIFLVFPAMAAKPSLVIKEKFDGDWPFKRPEIMIQCLENERVIAIHASSLASYALNENAKEAAKTLNGYKPVEDILLTDDKGNSKDLTAMIELGKTLCD